MSWMILGMIEIWHGCYRTVALPSGRYLLGQRTLESSHVVSKRPASILLPRIQWKTTDSLRKIFLSRLLMRGDLCHTLPKLPTMGLDCPPAARIMFIVSLPEDRQSQIYVPVIQRADSLCSDRVQCHSITMLVSILSLILPRIFNHRQIQYVFARFLYLPRSQLDCFKSRQN